ncbi:MAG: hypothetical protein PVS2B1_26320 [Candidatus Dormibacteraceae bacterium]
MDNLGTEGAFEVLARARALEAKGQNIIHLEIGEPDFATPENIIEAAYGAMHSDFTHYTPAGEVVMVPGSKNVLLFTLMSCIEPGDEVILPDPGYPVYESLVNFIEARPVPIRLREERGFRMDLDELASLVTDRTRLIIVNSPQNPTCW